METCVDSRSLLNIANYALGLAIGHAYDIGLSYFHVSKLLFL